MEVDFDRLTAEIIRIYSDAEFEIMDRVRARLERGVPEDRAQLREWERRRLGEIRQLRHELERTLGRIDNEVAGALQSAIEEAFRIGFEGAARDLGQLAQFVRALTPEQLEGISRSALRLAEESLGKLRATHAAILRQSMDAYRSVIRDVIGVAVAQAAAPRVAMQRALNRFADRGITSFVDRRGRRWDMVTYSDMATRTAAQRAAVHGYLDTVGEAGVDLVEVVNIPEECPICRPWEGRVLVRSGSHPTYPSVDEAMQGGLFHPNCRHGLTIWVEGLPGAPANRQTRTQKAGRQPKGLSDEEGYQERLRHRQLERNLRKAKLRQAVALKGPARLTASRRVAKARNDLKSFLGRTGRKRQPWRESVKGRGAGKARAKPKTARAPKVRASKPEPKNRGAWKPAMSRKEADRWAKGSAYKRDIYHQTNYEGRNRIPREGFDLKRTAWGRLWGHGVYGALDDATARLYRGRSAVRLTMRANVRNPIRVRVIESDFEGPAYGREVVIEGVAPEVRDRVRDNFNAALDELDALEDEARRRYPPYSTKQGRTTDEVRDQNIRRNEWLKKQSGYRLRDEWEVLQEQVEKEGYDSIIIEVDRPGLGAGGRQIVIFDKRDVTVITDE